MELHREYEGLGTSIADWNVGRWVVIRGAHLGVYYGKMDAVRAMGPLSGNPVVVLAASEADADAILVNAHIL